MKIIHTGDWHFQDRDHDEVEKCVNALIESARNEKPDVTVISGDITNSQELKLDSKSAKTIVRQVSELADISPVAIIIGTPSHDGNSAEILSYVKGKHQIWVSKMPEQIYLKDGRLSDRSGIGDNIPDAIITQIPTPTKQYFQSDSSIAASDKQIAEAMSNLFGVFGVLAEKYPDVPHILSGHFQMGGAYISETQQLIGRDIEISTDQIAMANAHVNCLGHIHMSQEMKNNTFYSGSIYRKDHGETEDKGFYIHTIEKGETTKLIESRFCLTPSRKLANVRFDFVNNPFTESGEIHEQIIAGNQADCKGAHVKVVLNVYQDEAGKINQADLERTLIEQYGAETATVKLVRIPRTNVRAEKVIQLTTLREKVAELGKLRLEEVPETILNKADLLETMTADDLMNVVGGVN